MHVTFTVTFEGTTVLMMVLRCLQVLEVVRPASIFKGAVYVFLRFAVDTCLLEI